MGWLLPFSIIMLIALPVGVMVHRLIRRRWLWTVRWSEIFGIVLICFFVTVIAFLGWFFCTMGHVSSASKSADEMASLGLSQPGLPEEMPVKHQGTVAQAPTPAPEATKPVAPVVTIPYSPPPQPAVVPKPQVAIERLPVPKCVEIEFDADEGGYVHFSVESDSGPLPPSRCNTLRQGNGSTNPWWGHCDDDDCPVPVKYVQQFFDRPVEVIKRYAYPVKTRHQILSFDTAIWARTVQIVREDPEGNRTKGVYIHPRGPGNWAGRYHVEIGSDKWQPAGD